MLRGMSFRPSLAFAGLAFATAWFGCGGDAAPPELRVDLSPEREDLQGFEEVRGTVMFSESVPAGRVAHLQLKRSRPSSLDDADASATATASLAAAKLTFTIRRIVPDDYTLFAWVDLDGDGRVGAGDLAGYYAGATTAPLQQPAAAQILTVQNLVTADFGIGPLAP